MNSNTRPVYSDDAICVRSFTLATFLHARGHAILHVSKSSHNGDVEFHFAPDARADIDLFGVASEHVKALTERFTGLRR